MHGAVRCRRERGETRFCKRKETKKQRRLLVKRYSRKVRDGKRE